MSRKALILASAASLMLGASAASSLAQQPAGHRGGPERMFVHLLQQFDTDKNGQISKEEARAGGEKLFLEIDADKDGSVTPGEMRKHREAKIAEWRKAAEAKPSETANANDTEQAGKDRKDRPRHGHRMDGRHDGHGWGQGWRGHGYGMRADDRGPQWGRKDGAGEGPRGWSRMIHSADANENGQIDKAEALAMLDKMFTRMDRDNDGVITAQDMPKRPFGIR